MPSKIASGKNFGAKRLEEFWPNPHALAGQIFVGRCHVAFGQDAVAPAIAAQQAKTVQACGLNAGQRFQSQEQLLVKCGSLFGIDAIYKIDVELNDVLAIEPHVHSFEVAQRADEESRADEQHQRERHLRHDQRLIQPLARYVSRDSARRAFERGGEINPAAA